MNNSFARKKRFVKIALLRVLLILILLTMLFPLAWNILSSLKTNVEYMKNPFSLPERIAWENYARAMQTSNMAVTIKNSVYVVFVSLAVVLVCSVPCSYVLVRYRFPGSKTILSMVLAGLFVTADFIIIALFLELRSIKMLNNLTMLGVVYATFSLPYSIFILTGFMREIPRDYEEAAIIDGCSPFGVLKHIIIPLSKSVIVTVGMINVLTSWSEYVIALVVVTDPVKKTFPVGIAELYQVAKFATDWGGLFAALTISLLPTLVLFLFGERYAVKGISIGGLKG